MFNWIYYLFYLFHNFFNMLKKILVSLLLILMLLGNTAFAQTSGDDSSTSSEEGGSTVSDTNADTENEESAGADLDNAGSQNEDAENSMSGSGKPELRGNGLMMRKLVKEKLENKFNDVNEDDDTFTPVQYLKKQNVLKGYEDGSFKPQQKVNRAELMKILVVGQGIEPSAEEYSNCFPDVKTEWFAPYVCYAFEQEWVEGYPNGMFHPEKHVNRAEAAKMILNSLGVEIDETSDLYSDVPEDSWFAKFARTMKHRNLLDLPNFAGAVGMTRAEVAIMLYRILVMTDQDAEAFGANLEANFNEDAPVDLILHKNDKKEATAENLNSARELIDEAIVLGVSGGDWMGALSKFQEASRLAPRVADAWAGKAYAHFKLEEPYKARFEINHALMLSHRRPVYYAIKAAVLYALEQPERAKTHLMMAAKMREKHGMASDPLPAEGEWDGLTDEELAQLAEDAVEAWVWDEELTAEEWPDADYDYDEDVEIAGEDEVNDVDDQNGDEDAGEGENESDTEDEGAMEDEGDDSDVSGSGQAEEVPMET